MYTHQKKNPSQCVNIILNINYLASASIIEEDILDFSSSERGRIISKKSFSYQPITCKWGRFGATAGEYVNRTLIKCLTPHIQDV
jgi:hypothetical protein